MRHQFFLKMASSNQNRALINRKMNNKNGENDNPEQSEMAKYLTKGNYGNWTNR